MQNLTNPTYIRALMAKYEVTFSKKMGQNFLINPGICPRMAAESGAGSGVGVLEIGPGVGVLTRELAALADKVVAVELDRRLIPLLGETLADCPNAKVVEGDALGLDLHALIRDEFTGMEVVVAANLPYYITSPVIMRLLEERLPIKAITVMVQKEAAERICAPMPSRQSGAITAAVRWYTEPEILFTVSPGSFLPPPDVQSAVIRLALRSEPPAVLGDESAFFKVVKAAFSQRRKTLLNCLSAGLSLSKDDARALLDSAGIAPATRAEQLGIEEFARLANEL
jgi:16S rRNA (adenine1518-N6/adenine1519-N6)-dimethyltransferase